MAEVGEAISGTLGSIFSGSVLVASLIGVGLLVLAVVGSAIYYFGIYKRKFNIIARITSRRSEDNNKVFFDRAAILFDKKKDTRYLRLLNTKVDLEVPKFNILTNTNWGDYVDIVRESELGFRFLTSPRIARGVAVGLDGKLKKINKRTQIPIEQSVQFILDRQRQNKSIIDPESFLLKLLSFAPQIISMVMSMMILWVVFRYAPDFLSQLTRSIQELKAANAPTIIEGMFMPLLR